MNVNYLAFKTISQNPKESLRAQEKIIQQMTSIYTAFYQENSKLQQKLLFSTRGGSNITFSFWFFLSMTSSLNDSFGNFFANTIINIYKSHIPIAIKISCTFSPTFADDSKNKNPLLFA